MRMRAMASLNGTWQLQGTNDETLPADWDYTVPVPALVDAVVPPYDWKKFRFHWYRTRFRLRDASELVFLVIEQAMFGTEVWLNGKHLGGDIGCYTSQEYDASSAVNFGGESVLVVRVGTKDSLPPESAVGNDLERTEFIPGIWGDVNLVQSGNPRVKLTQVIPHIERGEAEARVSVENRGQSDLSSVAVARVFERVSRKPVSEPLSLQSNIPARKEVVLHFPMPMPAARLWSIGDPFLYELDVSVTLAGSTKDVHRTTFGMREFVVRGSDFVFNGKRIFLKGGNIAFHRFLSDKDRGTLPWDIHWIKKVLIDIPKAHNFNFFRNHLGQMYNRWYDVADEYGMLLQNEWPFWTVSGSKEQITSEFTRWLRDNWNHPSIIIWDALNECSDAVVQNEIVPAMKKIDPTRPWESVDFIEQHPYIYSLGPVLNDRKFGFTESLDAIEHSPMPSMVNEFLWWWIDKNGEPAPLTRDVVERWLGKDYSPEDLLEWQSFLAEELVGLFRRMRVDAIQPFVYISNDAGPTANWFAGNIKDLTPKPVLRALKNAFAPFGLSLELWDRHFFAGETRSVRLFVFNDDPVPKTGTVRFGVANVDGTLSTGDSLDASLGPGDYAIIPINVHFPDRGGEYGIVAELYPPRAKKPLAVSRKIAYVFDRSFIASPRRDVRVSLLARDDELSRFLQSKKISVESLDAFADSYSGVLTVGEGMVEDWKFRAKLASVRDFVSHGGALIIIEPEFGISGKKEIRLFNGLSLTIERREDTDRGGYDSYVFAEDHRHPLWNGIEKKHLHMFNGGFGGETVSQHDVTCSVDHSVHARCGLKLRVEVVLEIPFGKGSVLVSRIQTRGRLVQRGDSAALHDRRPDPVAQRYVLNLISYAHDSSTKRRAL